MAAKRGPKHGHLLGIKISSTSREGLLNSVREKLKNKEKFYIVTPNPEIVLMATKDWLLKKAIFKSDFSVPDGIGLAQAYKFLSLEDNHNFLIRPLALFYQGLKVGLSTFYDKKYLTDSLNIIKGRELFLDLIGIADDKKLRVYLFGGENREQLKAVEVLSQKYKNVIFKTNYNFPVYNRNGQPATLNDRLIHKKVIGNIKMFEPDLIFVAMTPPKQEKWIFRNFFRLKSVGAMAVGGTFNYIAGSSKLPPKWISNIGLEWVWRLISEPFRYKRIFNSFPIFPWVVFTSKLFRKKYDSAFSVVDK